jgi:hypothetical protein
VNAAAKTSPPPFWAITCYFNPQHYQRRLQNYRTFRENLKIPLVTVELSLDGRFELRPDEADIMIQVRGQDVLWHKERLLNIALNALPPDCRKFAWLDCDVIFQQPDWAAQASDALDEFPVIQPFQDVCELARDVPPGQPDHPDNLRIGRSLAHGLAVGAVGADMLGENMRLKGWNSGLAWAGRRDAFEHGFYDACVMGSGNRAIMCAELGRFDHGCGFLKMSDRWKDHYLAWARPHLDYVRGKVGFIGGTVIHLWHGDLKDRRYADRHGGFRRFDFDPAVDIAVNEQGCWRWSSDKPLMHQYVRDYFVARKEDG